MDFGGECDDVFIRTCYVDSWSVLSKIIQGAEQMTRKKKETLKEIGIRSAVRAKQRFKTFWRVEKNVAITIPTAGDEAYITSDGEKIDELKEKIIEVPDEFTGTVTDLLNLINGLEYRIYELESDLRYIKDQTDENTSDISNLQ